MKGSEDLKYHGVAYTVAPRPTRVLASLSPVLCTGHQVAAAQLFDPRWSF